MEFLWNFGELILEKAQILEIVIMENNLKIFQKRKCGRFLVQIVCYNSNEGGNHEKKKATNITNFKNARIKH